MGATFTKRGQSFRVAIHANGERRYVTVRSKADAEGLVREIRRQELAGVAGNEVMLEALAELLEPEQADGGEDLALVGNAVGHDDVVGADAIGGDDEQALAQVVNVAHLAATDREGEVASNECVEHVGERDDIAPQ